MFQSDNSMQMTFQELWTVHIQPFMRTLPLLLFFSEKKSDKGTHLIPAQDATAYLPAAC